MHARIPFPVSSFLVLGESVPAAALTLNLGADLSVLFVRESCPA
jgi:hypothetical protein